MTHTLQRVIMRIKQISISYLFRAILNKKKGFKNIGYYYYLHIR